MRKKWLDALSVPLPERAAAQAGERFSRYRAYFRVPEDVEDAILAEVAKRRALIEEAEAYKISEIAKRYSLARRTVHKVLLRRKAA